MALLSHLFYANVVRVGKKSPAQLKPTVFISVLTTNKNP